MRLPGRKRTRYCDYDEVLEDFARSLGLLSSRSSARRRTRGWRTVTSPRSQRAIVFAGTSSTSPGALPVIGTEKGQDDEVWTVTPSQPWSRG